MADELKYGASLSFVDGLIFIRSTGYGDANGSGSLSFKDDDLQWGDGEDHGWRSMSLPKSELESIRDFLNQWLPVAVAEGRFIDEIEARVRPTICQTYSSRGPTVEGRISEDDFDVLLTAARRDPVSVETVARAIALADGEDYMEDCEHYDDRARAAMKACGLTAK